MCGIGRATSKASRRSTRGSPRHVPGLHLDGRLAREHDVHFAAVHDIWFPGRPASWIPCGRLRLGTYRAAVADDVVKIYATDPATCPLGVSWDRTSE